MINNTNLGIWISGTPGYVSNLYVYDNDGDTFGTDGDGCANGFVFQGVYLNIWDEKILDIANILDKMTDGSDGCSCGRIVWDISGYSGNFIGYRLANNSSDLKF